MDEDRAELERIEATIRETERRLKILRERGERGPRFRDVVTKTDVLMFGVGAVWTLAIAAVVYYSFL